MRIVINIMLNAGDRCDMDRTELINAFKEQLNKGLSYHLQDHIHSMEFEE